MMDQSPRRNGVSPVASKLFLLFCIGEDRYALEATEIAEILPRVKLKAIARAPHWVAGIFAHRGEIVPVIDISALNSGQPARARTSTRMVLVHYRHDDAHPAQLLGLILEQATETLRCAASEFKEYGLENRLAPYLGPVREDELGLLQWIHVQELLSEPVRELLYPVQPLDLASLEDAP
ncbi:purine-binding chemotaxis protein CheW [Pseudomonas sp. CDFA 602]|uniref:chemotaxis protein CheW n=1 Tax=Pseudomonas californiensis TaxID=2829823 RepID=UPI001E509F28|nr:chemotaxis protein CheW [Pseudomonas californiensis]MCD5993768.1 purine-binding chemotaxis protein CheW [Pseudomonas californiensis]MCD5999363.1 purine-binding chemotaxis protein CheW [Pseudomonas californiensis]